MLCVRKEEWRGWCCWVVDAQWRLTVLGRWWVRELLYGTNKGRHSIIMSVSSESEIYLFFILYLYRYSGKIDKEHHSPSEFYSMKISVSIPVQCDTWGCQVLTSDWIRASPCPTARWSRPPHRWRHCSSLVSSQVLQKEESRMCIAEVHSHRESFSLHIWSKISGVNPPGFGRC